MDHRQTEESRVQPNECSYACGNTQIQPSMPFEVIRNAPRCEKMPAAIRRKTRQPICRCPELVPERATSCNQSVLDFQYW
eukprot:6212822-Pleurochrysis_carterae.AAC.2